MSEELNPEARTYSDGPEQRNRPWLQTSESFHFVWNQLQRQDAYSRAMGKSFSLQNQSPAQSNSSTKQATKSTRVSAVSPMCCALMLKTRKLCWIKRDLPRTSETTVKNAAQFVRSPQPPSPSTISLFVSLQRFHFRNLLCCIKVCLCQQYRAQSCQVVSVKVDNRLIKGR